MPKMEICTRKKAFPICYGGNFLTSPTLSAQLVTPLHKNMNEIAFLTASTVLIIFFLSYLFLQIHHITSIPV